MPGGDRTGPQGLGPRTGRGLGDCEPLDQPRLGFGFGRGRGRRYWARATGQPGWLRFGGWGTPPPSVDESALLKAQAEQLQAQLVL
ncbi:MAG TPA: DUF5320 domain-containing protein [Anaerolineae bacterium]|nr:DUF5320 domain-containing protein [Anaerolineae bacterium]HQH39380.1 DUF5320 domain-containing protein [Anaerolineae bacterium]